MSQNQDPTEDPTPQGEDTQGFGPGPHPQARPRPDEEPDDTQGFSARQARPSPTEEPDDGGQGHGIRKK